ncbi:polyketide cyclase / dehydrase and lipid transport family protein [Collimonas arenae]|uniref:Polyketide cyclase / dehydrase and lipid transport family protein n=1 Tax=Collimonas arenae TaxID=279058 RepID=A0A127PNI7_9BURK|nr:SRPBCC family protein [Collimonas arenae]AMO99327.1 polyketide cyclase / dehydrase and lipid transport family protein [Collimonas arenae]AMP09230.1 polyketide cyclase / dehydrase and lipid transport family protein [Collimonas arenae]
MLNSRFATRVAFDKKDGTMWTHEESIETTATPARIWELFSNVPGWVKWNSGIESIQIHGPFAHGTTFAMRIPGDISFTSVLTEVRENESFTDETVIEGTRVLVHHKIVPLASGRTKVIYSTEVTGPAAAEFGPMVTADFPDVLGALKNIAENP